MSQTQRRNLHIAPVAFVMLTFTGLSGCADRAPIETAPAVVTQPIINGFAPDAARHGATVALLERYASSVSPDIYCSGTLVTPEVVVTAAHCLTTVKGRKVRTTPPSEVAISVGDGTYTDPDGVAYAAVETLVHPGYDDKALLNDIALVRVSPPVTEVTPVPVLPHALGFSASDFGETLNFAGFGDDEYGQYNVKLQANGSLGGLGCTVSGCFDSGDAATQISYNQYSSGPCFGDSGGPAFVNRGGTWYLAGVTSYGDNYCTQYGVSTRVDAFESWIADFAGEAPTCVADGYCDASCADDPDCAPPTCVADGYCDPACADDPDCAPPSCVADGYCDPACADDPDCGTSGGSCGDGICDADESCDGRSGTSACEADCPGKTTGKPTGRYCYVGGACDGPGCP